MYAREKIFTMSIIAALFQRGIKTLRFNDDWYLHAIENMQHYFHNHRNDYGSLSSELSILFIKDSNGEYSQFNKAVENLNAGLLIFDNPFYVCAHIKEDTDAEAILRENNDDIPLEIVNGFVDAFCKGLPSLEELNAVY